MHWTIIKLVSCSLTVWNMKLISPKKVWRKCGHFKSSYSMFRRNHCRRKSYSKRLRFRNNRLPYKRIKFTCDQKIRLHLELAEKAVEVNLSDNLRDMFVFDQNTFIGKGTFSGSDVFSLSRRIHYLYIYSSVSTFVHIGDTEAPLLAVIPFQKPSLATDWKRRTLSTVYVVVITDHISQIGIGICDGAGQLILFTRDAVTTLVLHFRQV